MNNINDTFRDKVSDLLSRLTLDEKLRLLSTHHFPVERLGMGDFFIGHEVARGYVGRNDNETSTVFPQPVGLAGTFDRELMSQLGEIAGTECRAYHNENGKKGCLCVWGPTVDMERDPRWGRTEEAYGEDVFLAGEMTAAYTKSMAGDNGKYLKTVPTLKHFCANNNEEKRMSCNASIPLRLKYEYYYAAFMNAIRFGGARSVMTAYNEINGVPALCNPELKTILKEQWGLWFAVTDGGDFTQTVTAHRYCPEHSQVIAEAIKAGCDTMTDNSEAVRAAAETALKNGLLTEADIDEAVGNALYARARLGMFAEDCPYDSITMADVDTEQSQQVNLRAAREQVVLLKNDGILPITGTPEKIAAVGPLADENLMDWYTGTFAKAVSVREGLAAEFPESEIVYDSLWDIVAVKAPNGKYLTANEDGSVTAAAETVGEAEMFELQDWGENWQNLFSVKYKRYVRNTDGQLKLHNRRIYDWFTHETFNLRETESGTLIEEFLGHQRLCLSGDKLYFNGRRSVSDDVLFKIETVSSGRERAGKIASDCGYVIFCDGNYPVQVAKECHDRKTLRLNIQEGMAELLHSVNPNTVLLLISSYPFSICREDEILPAVLYSTHAGPHLGTACAETISGKNPPSGRLAMTWYRSEFDLPDIMEYDIASAGTTYMYFSGTPLYPFGYGLSYADFEYSDMSVSAAGKGAEVTLRVSNISGTDSDEIIQLYFTADDSDVPRPIKKLCGFSRISLKAGETKEVKLTVPEHILQIYDVRAGKMITETGHYTFMAGRSSADIRLSAGLDITGESLSQRGESFTAESFDSAECMRINYSRKLARHYITARGWRGSAVYGGVQFAGKKTVTIAAAAYLDSTTINVICGETELEIKLNACDSFDDVTEYTAVLPEGLPETGELALSIPEGVNVFSIRLE